MVGPFTVNLVSLDDTDPDTGRWGPNEVVTNARRAIADRNIMAYIGDSGSGATALVAAAAQRGRRPPDRSDDRLRRAHATRGPRRARALLPLRRALVRADRSRRRHPGARVARHDAPGGRPAPRDRARRRARVARPRGARLRRRQRRRSIDVATEQAVDRRRRRPVGRRARRRAVGARTRRSTRARRPTAATAVLDALPRPTRTSRSSRPTRSRRGPRLVPRARSGGAAAADEPGVPVRRPAAEGARVRRGVPARLRARAAAERGVQLRGDARVPRRGQARPARRATTALRSSTRTSRCASATPRWGAGRSPRPGTARLRRYAVWRVRDGRLEFVREAGSDT